MCRHRLPSPFTWEDTSSLPESPALVRVLAHLGTSARQFTAHAFGPACDERPPTRVEVGRQGFDHAADIYASIQKEQPAFKLDADAVAWWANDLLADGHFPDAIDIMKLDIQLDPSSCAYGSLGEMYMKSGQKRAAIESYKKAPKWTKAVNACWLLWREFSSCVI
jgi:tetratricopeptide (TPR) repeat protein